MVRLHDAVQIHGVPFVYAVVLVQALSYLTQDSTSVELPTRNSRQRQFQIFLSKVSTTESHAMSPRVHGRQQQLDRPGSLRLGY